MCFILIFIKLTVLPQYVNIPNVVLRNIIDSINVCLRQLRQETVVDDRLRITLKLISVKIFSKHVLPVGERTTVRFQFAHSSTRLHTCCCHLVPDRTIVIIITTSEQFSTSINSVVCNLQSFINSIIQYLRVVENITGSFCFNYLCLYQSLAWWKWKKYKFKQLRL